jgi:putative endonuclease
LKRFYVGALQESLESRIQRHNNHFYGTSKFTSKATDWKLFLFIECECYSQAIAIERHYQKDEKLCLYPQLGEIFTNAAKA